MKKIEKGTVYHIAIAVNDISASEKLYENILDLEVKHRETVQEQGVNTVMLQPRSGEGAAIELLEPLQEDSPVGKFLEKRGEGIHHICFFVEDIESKLSELKGKGIKLIDEKPRAGAYNAKVAFIHPKALNGVLIELAEICDKE